MYYAISKFIFESDYTTKDDAKLLKSLTEKIQTRFKVCAKSLSDINNGCIPTIVIAALDSSEQKLNQRLDQIAIFLEESGYGRLYSESTILDHIDSYDI